MKARIALALLITAMAGTKAAAQTVALFDNFDGYADQAAFEVAWPRLMGGAGVPAGAPADLLPSNTLSTEQFLSPGFSLRNQSDVALVPPDINASSRSQRNERVFGETTISTTLGIRYSFDFYDIAPTVAPYRQNANLQDGTAPSATNQLVSMGLSNNQTAAANGGQRYMGRILGYNPATDTDGTEGAEEGGAAGSYFKFNDYGSAGLRAEGWRNLKVEITTDDGLSTDYNFYVDGVLAETVLNVGTTASIRSYDVVRVGAGFSSTQIAYYDNVKVETFTVGTTPVNDADFDGDGDIDGEDFLTWQRGNGGPGDLADGDADGDNDVDGNDLAVWRTQYGTATVAAAAVPEPASVALAALAILAGVSVTRRR